jgi:hypothetical protein
MINTEQDETTMRGENTKNCLVINEVAIEGFGPK